MSADIGGRVVSVLREAASRLGDREPGAAQRLAQRFGIGGYVYRHTTDQPERARAAQLLAGLIERNLLDAAREMSHELEQRGIPHFFAKGVALADRVYRPGDREMADIDVHVTPAARIEALETLRRLGYEQLTYPAQGAPDSMRASVSLQRVAETSQIDHVAVDLRWGTDPVDRLLPRCGKVVPDVIWRSLDRSGQLPVPADAHHVALVVHHLVHHDMLHVRGLLDVLLLWQRVTEGAGVEIERVADELRVRRALRILSRLLEVHFAVDPRGVSRCPDDARARRALAMLEPVTWCTWAAEAPASEFVEASSRRVARRLLLSDDLRAAVPLLEDALFPPVEYLRWRWPQSRSLAAARVRHLLRVARKALGRS